MTNLPQYQTSALTDEGRRREHNEDAVIVKDGIWIVADGIGGRKHGAVASRTVVNDVAVSYLKSDDLQASILGAQQYLLEKAHGDRSLDGMATTIVAAASKGEQFEIMWLGDSRAYKCAGQQLQQLTRDHTVPNALLDAGEISAEEIPEHPRRHVLTQCLRADSGVKLDIGVTHTSLDVGEYLLLCSDGLYNELTDAEMARIIDTNNTMEDKTRWLIDLALEKGGRDNISAIVIQRTQ